MIGFHIKFGGSGKTLVSELRDMVEGVNAEAKYGNVRNKAEMDVFDRSLIWIRSSEAMTRELLIKAAEIVKRHSKARLGAIPEDIGSDKWYGRDNKAEALAVKAAWPGALALV